jgi:hypothetical protein
MGFDMTAFFLKSLQKQGLNRYTQRNLSLLRERRAQLEVYDGGKVDHGRPQHGVDQDGAAGRPLGAESGATGPKIPIPVADAGGAADADHADADDQG